MHREREREFKEEQREAAARKRRRARRRAKGTEVFVVVDKRGRPCTGNIFMGLVMPVSETKRFLSEGKIEEEGGRVRVGVKRWVYGERIVKMRLVPIRGQKR